MFSQFIFYKFHSELTFTVQACLNFLLAKGVAVEEIRADEIHEGNMKEGAFMGQALGSCTWLGRAEGSSTAGARARHDAAMAATSSTVSGGSASPRLA